MSVSGISSQSATSSIAAVMRKLSSATSSSGTDSTSSASGTDSAKISGPGEFMSKLQQLKDSDPEKFKTTMQGVADKLKSAAESATDSHEKEMLTSMAEKFSSVAQGGELSQLEPPKPPSLSANGQKAYGAGESGDKKMMGQMMGGMQGPPPGPPPDGTQGTDTSSSSGSSSGTSMRDTLKSIFDDLNTTLTQALSSK